MQLNQLKRKIKNAAGRRVGRGGKRGKTSGKGHKGQKARAGHKMRPEARDMIKKLPKRRGYGKNRARTVNSSAARPVPVNIGAIDKRFSSGDTVSPSSLFSLGLVRRIGGKLPVVKILSKGKIGKAVKVENCLFSKEAENKIKAAGGSVAKRDI